MKSKKPTKPLRDVLLRICGYKQILKYQECELLSGIAEGVLKHFHFAMVTALM